MRDGSISYGDKAKVDRDDTNGHTTTQQTADPAAAASESQPPAGSIPSGRDARGKFLPGNRIGEICRFPPGNFAALQHSLRAANLPPELAHLAADVEEFVAGCLTDEGNASDVSRRRASLIQYRARIHRRILQLDSMLELKGLVDKRGKLRVTWLQQLGNLVNTAKAIDSLLGLARKAKRIPTAAEYLAGAEVSESGDGQ